MLSLEDFRPEVHSKFHYGPGLFIISVEDKKTSCAVSLAVLFYSTLQCSSACMIFASIAQDRKWLVAC